MSHTLSSQINYSNIFYDPKIDSKLINENYEEITSAL